MPGTSRWSTSRRRSSVKNGVIDNARIACGGVSCVPRRLTAVEQIVKGKPMGEDIAKLAGASATRGRQAAELQSVQDPADGQPGDARRPRRAGLRSVQHCSATRRRSTATSDVVIGASWDLLPWFVAVGAAFIIVHAVVKAIAGRRGHAH